MKKSAQALFIGLIAFELTLIGCYFLLFQKDYNNSKTYLEFPIIDPQKSPTCNIFLTHSEAQQFFEANKSTMPSLLQLDNDRDGIVCEALP